MSIFLVCMPLMSLIAEFRAPIQQAIPRIVDVLRHNSKSARQSAACLLEKLSSQGAIYWILNLNTPDSLCPQWIIVPLLLPTFNIFFLSSLKIPISILLVLSYLHTSLSKVSR